MTRSHTSAPASASARPAGRGRSPFVAAQVLAGPRHARTRQAMLVGMAVAMLAAAGGVHAAESEAVPVSIEGKTFKVEAPVQTQVLVDSPEKRVESGTSANGAPVIVTRLSYRKREWHVDKEDDDGQAQERKDVAGQSATGTTGEADSVNKDVTNPATEDAVSSSDASAAATDDTEGAEAPHEEPVAVKATRASAEELEPFVIHAVTPHSVSMAWESDPSVVYNVSRNGQPIAQVSGGKYVDETVSPGTEYQYSIEPATAPTGASGKPGMSGVIQVRTPETPESGGAVASTARATKVVSKGGDGPTETIYKHRAFIPNDWVDISQFENMGCGAWPTQNVRFKGDDRSWSDIFDIDPNRSRTVLTIQADWRSSPAKLSRGIHVSRTTRIIDGKEEVKRASPNFGWFRDSASNSEGTYLAAYIYHFIGNPFCWLGQIRYEEEVHMWNDGSISIIGHRRQAPRHEGLVALRFGNGLFRGPWRLYRLENVGFKCLVGDNGVDGQCVYEEYRARNSL